EQDIALVPMPVPPVDEGARPRGAVTGTDRSRLLGARIGPGGRAGGIACRRSHRVLAGRVRACRRSPRLAGFGPLEAAVDALAALVADEGGIARDPVEQHVAEPEIELSDAARALVDGDERDPPLDGPVGPRLGPRAPRRGFEDPLPHRRDET